MIGIASKPFCPHSQFVALVPQIDGFAAATPAESVFSGIPVQDTSAMIFTDVTAKIDCISSKFKFAVF